MRLQLFSNLTACQALGNMCVMNMHSFSGMSADACGLFNTIFRAKAALSSTQDISYWYLKCFFSCMYIATFFALILFFTHDSITESFLLIWSPGEAVCRGFTMGKSLDWPFECFKQNPFLFVLVSEGKTRLVKTFNYLWVLKINKTEITHPNRNKSIIL